MPTPDATDSFTPDIPEWPAYVKGWQAGCEGPIEGTGPYTDRKLQNAWLAGRRQGFTDKNKVMRRQRNPEWTQREFFYEEE